MLKNKLTIWSIQQFVGPHIWIIAESHLRTFGPIHPYDITETTDDKEEESEEWEVDIKVGAQKHNACLSRYKSSGEIWFTYCDCDNYNDQSLCFHVAMLASQLRRQLNPALNLEDTVARAKKLLEQPYQERLALGKKIIGTLAGDRQKKSVKKMDYQQFKTTLNSLGSLEQNIMKAMALECGEMSDAKVLKLLKDADITKGGRALSSSIVGIALDELVDKNLLRKTKSTYTVAVSFEFVQDYCCEIMDYDAEFKQLLQYWYTQGTTNRWSYYSYSDATTNERLMNAAFYLKQHQQFESSTNLLRSTSSKWTDEYVLQYWMPAGAPSAAMLENASPEILINLLSESIKISISKLLPCEQHAAALQTLLDQRTITDVANRYAILFLARYHFLCSNWPAYQSAKQQLGDSAAKLSLDALELFAQKQSTPAIDTFRATEKLLRKETGTSRTQLGGWSMVFRVLALLQRGEASDLDQGITILSKTDEVRHNFENSFQPLLALCCFYQNDKASAQFALSNSTFTDIDGLFGFLAKFVMNGGKLEKADAVLAEDLRTKARKNGYNWVVDELDYLLRPDQQPPLHADGFAKLGTMLPIVEEWQNALNLLLSLTTPKAADAAKSGIEGQTRLVWFVNFEKPEVEIKEQTYGKKGWTSGRVVSNTRLANNDINNLLPQDSAAIKHLFRRDHYYSYYNPDLDRVWPHLIGHPLLFLLKSPTVAVQLERQDPIIVAKETPEGGYKMVMSPAVTKVGAQIIKETPTRYKLVVATEQHLKIATALGNNGLVVPEQGYEKFSQAISNLAGVVTVESSVILANEEVPEVPAEVRTCVHMLPVGNGFHVELYAKPFGTTAPYFKPGEGEERAVALVEGRRTQTKRDLKAEVANARALVKQIPVLAQNGTKLTKTWELEDTDQCLDFLTEMHPLLQNHSIILEWPKGEKYKVVRTIGTDALHLQVREKGHWFQVDGTVRLDENRVMNMLELLELADRQRSPFIEIAPGQFMALTKEFRDKLRAVQGLMSKDKSGQLSVHNLATGALSVLTDAVQQAEFDEKFKQQKTRIQEAFDKKYKVPKNFNASLRPYQEEGFQWLHRLKAWGVGACLADDMGLGKTIQALAFLTDQAKQGPALVVAPLSVSRNWLSETAKFAPALTPILFGEGDRELTVKKVGKGDLLVVTYDMLARESELFTQKKWATVILDEAQAIKNRSTKRSETAMLLQADFKIIMSGTPVENHLGELWNLFQFTNPGLLGSIDQFNERFALPIEKYKDDDRRNTLRRLVQPFILRRRKDEVLKDLPAKTEITLRVELSDEERAFYEALRRKALTSLESNNTDNAGEKHLMILAQIMKLRRAACHPRLADEHTSVKESAKEKLFAEIVEELVENGHKALVFSQFVTHLDILKKVLKRKNVAYQYLDGQTPSKTRQKSIEAFQNGEGDIFLISLKAGGTGLNLTNADYVIHMDPWWNPAVEDQATDRAHRIGQLKPVTVYRFVAENTIEDKIIQLHEQKRDLADSLLSGTGESARLTADQLMELLKS